MKNVHEYFGFKLSLSACYLLLAGFSSWVEANSITLQQTLALLEQHNPALASAKAAQDRAEAGLITARQYPNPDVEIAGGLSTGLGDGALSGSNEAAFVSQALDLPFVRDARRQVAEAGISSAEQANRQVWLLVQAQTQQAFYDILRRKAQLQVSEDNEKLLQQIRDKVALKVEVGEAARYEIVKAEAELLNAIKLRNSALVEVQDAKSALRALFADAIPYDFDADGSLPPAPLQLPELSSLRNNVLDQQPALQQIRAEVQKAQANVELEQTMRYPVPTVKAGVEQDPGLKQWQIGISLPLPLWNQRQGQIAEASAGLRQSQADARQLELKIVRELENAYNRYLNADRQVRTFEQGLLEQAEKALQVAEAAYRLGERGILDYLDAQRTYRSVRNDYLNAQFDRQNALIDLEKLNGSAIKG
jgi:cobalt-zinc-cadmium efflux system outer membrane protein